MSFTLQLTLSYLLDLIFGDPKGVIHPVTIIAKIAKQLEKITRGTFRNMYVAGSFTALLTIVGSVIVFYLPILVLNLLSPILGVLFSVYVMYSMLATNGLATHANAVRKKLLKDDIRGARIEVGKIVGRDTLNMNEADISRATVESVGENMVDGVTAPIIFMVLFGPLGVILFKTCSTLDSLFGYKNERYLQFGFLSAKLDDVFTYVPARLTVLSSSIAAIFMSQSPFKVLRIARRDGSLHESPNSAYGESCVSALIGRSLGGEAVYAGKIVERSQIGDGKRVNSPSDISNAVRAMVLNSAIMFLLLLTFRGVIYGF